MHVEPYDLPAAGQKTVTGHGEEPAGVSGTLFLVLPPSGGALGRFVHLTAQLLAYHSLKLTSYS